MAKFMVVMPMVAMVNLEIEAENSKQAMEKALDTKFSFEDLDSATVGDHYEIDGEDIFATCIEMGRDFDMPARSDSK